MAMDQCVMDAAWSVSGAPGAAREKPREAEFRI